MAARAPKLTFLPQWTKRVVTELGGRDPLGLSRVGQLLTDLLLPGITTQTNRARYYALYCWILWHVHDQEKPHRWEEFVQAFQRREAVIALSTLFDDSDSSPVGIEAATKRRTEGEAAGEINTSFQVLPSNQLGGFGQYYGGSLYSLGLTHRPGDRMFRVTDDLGSKLAFAIQRTMHEVTIVVSGSPRRLLNGLLAPLRRRMLMMRANKKSRLSEDFCPGGMVAGEGFEPTTSGL